MKILVTKDFVMEDGEVAFTAGKEYDFTLEDGAWLGTDDQGEDHWMEDSDIRDLTEC